MSPLRRVGVLAATLGVAALTVSAQPAPSYAEPTGTPVIGGVSANQATELTPGVYVSTFPADGRDAYFKIARQWKGSRMWLGGNTISTKGNDPVVAFDATAGDTGTSCTTGGIMVSLDDFPIAGTAEGFEVAKECEKAPEIVLKVGSEDVPDGAQFQLIIWEEPPPTNRDALTKGPSKVTWTDSMPIGDWEPVTGGSDWASAPLLEDGTYSTTVGNGEVGLFAVPLEYGEHLQVQASVADYTGGYEPTDGVIFFNPFGAGLDPYIKVKNEPRGMLLYAPGEIQHWASPVVNWLPAGQDTSYASVAATPGDYYFTFDLANEKLPDQLKVEFSVLTVSHEDVVVPTYDVEVSPPQSLTPATEAPVDQDDPAAAESTAGRPVVAASLLFAGSAGFAILGAVLLARANRVRAARRGGVHGAGARG